MIRYIHGSADSTDLDVVYVFDELPSLQECHQFCISDRKENRNIIVVRDGMVAQSFKGILDEVNNAIMATYPLHEQVYPLLITRPAVRDVFLKDITVTRKVLSPLTQSPLRSQVKPALRSGWAERLSVMADLALTRVDFDNVGKWKKEDLLKSMAFQLGQAVGLHQGIELYTKADIATRFPALQPCLYRQTNDLKGLQSVFEMFLQHLQQTETIALPDNQVQLSSGAVYDVGRERRIL